MKVTICGREYSLKAETPEDQQSVKQIAAYIDARMAETAAGIPDEDFEKTCILTSLNLAAELLDLKGRASSAKKRLQHLLDALGGRPR